MDKKKRKKLKSGEKLEDRIAPSIIGGVTGIDEIPEGPIEVQPENKADSESIQQVPE